MPLTVVQLCIVAGLLTFVFTITVMIALAYLAGNRFVMNKPLIGVVVGVLTYLVVFFFANITFFESIPVNFVTIGAGLITWWLIRSIMHPYKD